MLSSFLSIKSHSIRRVALAGAVALTAAAAFVGAPAPAAAMHGPIFMHHGFGGMHHDFDRHMGFGMRRDFDFDRHMRFGMRHDFDFDRHRHFRHDFDDRIALGFGFFPGYVPSDYDSCFRRVWGSYGWRWIDVCQ
jgi:hypothetical protein